MEREEVHPRVEGEGALQLILKENWTIGVTMIMYTEVVDDESDDSHVIEWSEEGGRWSPWA